MAPRKIPEPPPSFLRRHLRTLLVIAVALLFVHDVFGANGFLAMRRAQMQVAQLHREIVELDAENRRLADEVKALKSDPDLIEKIAREQMGLARPGEKIFKLPPPATGHHDAPKK